VSAPQHPQVKPLRLIATLAGAGAIAGLFIVLAFEWAQPRILEHRAEVLGQAVQEVLGSPERTETLFLYEGQLTATPPAGIDTTRLERVFAGYDQRDRLVGFALTAEEPGFADVISLIYGYDAATRHVLGMKVLENKETPGLGDKIVKDSAFIAQFVRVVSPLRGVKQGAGKGADGEVELITGATISSRTVVGIINHSLERMVPLLAAYLQARPQ
jgi:electron transport complex protein RnfG